MTHHGNNFAHRSDRDHGGRDMKLQDVFLNFCRREKTMVNVHLIDRSIKKGQIIGFDNVSIILEEDGRQYLLYKSAVIAVNPQKQVNYIFNESCRSELFNRIQEQPVELGLSFAELEADLN